MFLTYVLQDNIFYNVFHTEHAWSPRSPMEKWSLLNFYIYGLTLVQNLFRVQTTN